jgi:hypothetical protein
MKLIFRNLRSCKVESVVVKFKPLSPRLSITDHNYGITALHNYGFMVRLSPEKLENQSLEPFKIEIDHRKGTLTHIQLPS